jgi:hypothetical protein
VRSLGVLYPYIPAAAEKILAPSATGGIAWERAALGRLRRQRGAPA